MNTARYKEFVKVSAQRTKMHEIQKNLYYNIGKYDEAVPKGKAQFCDIETSKEVAHQIKKEALSKLHNHLLLFEQKATENGSQVLWAETGDDALKYIQQIALDKNARSVVKSKSMVSEEIHLNDFLLQMNIEPIETDLGEFIQQLDGEPPIHILTPAMHKSKQNVADLFERKLHTEAGLSPQALTKVARATLRNKYLQAEIGITGANFILPDIGGIALTENEGNARLTVGFPKTHIVIVGIEKVLNSSSDLALFWPLLATYGTGQYLTSYSSIITGPKTLLEKNGPDEMYIILLDNGRTNILKDEQKRQSLYCIRCGACLNVCPVYTNMAGGHGYGTTYSGPIGSVISPSLKGFKELGHLSFASSLCGACTEVCPMKIKLHELLLHNRQQFVQQKGLTSLKERLVWKGWNFTMLHPSMLSLLNGGLLSLLINYVFLRSWATKRSPLVFARQHIKQLYHSYLKKTKNKRV